MFPPIRLWTLYPGCHTQLLRSKEDSSRSPKIHNHYRCITSSQHHHFLDPWHPCHISPAVWLHGLYYQKQHEHTQFTSLSVFVLPRPFPTEESLKDEDIYNNLEDLIEYVRGPLRGPVSSADGFAGLQAPPGVQTPTCFGKSPVSVPLFPSEAADE